MKKILVLVSFLIVAAACSTEPSSNKDTTSNANKAGEMKSTAAVSEADITAKDSAIWDTIKKKDYGAFGKMLANDYVEVEDDGVYDKPGIIAYVKDLDFSEITFSDRKMLPIDKDAVILTYDVSTKGTYKGKTIPLGPYHAAAAYVNRDGQWLGIYYQQTLARTAPQPSSQGSSQPAKSAATPSTKMAEAGSDPIVNEKLVWDALKSKNYDAFAAYLAPDSKQIAPDGVYDKAGSVKHVSMFDASKYQLSTWKSVKLDDDASLVTYMVASSGPNAEQERHSTIWVNRNGKWLALLHAGTPLAKPEPKK